MKRYVGNLRGDGSFPANVVVIDERGARPLRPRNDLRNHSPDGFAWGYGGSGPAQLALAILADAAGDEVAQRRYQDFKADVIAKLPQEHGWALSALDVSQWLARGGPTHG